DLAPAEMVIEKEAEPYQQGGTQAVVVGQHESQRPDDVRRHAEQHLTLLQRLAHEPEVVLLEIAQPAVDKLGRRRRSSARQVALLGKKHRQSTASRVACDAASVDAAADDSNVANHAVRAGALATESDDVDRC